jgi:hypothetical protein
VGGKEGDEDGIDGNWEGGLGILEVERRVGGCGIGAPGITGTGVCVEFAMGDRTSGRWERAEAGI